MKTKSMKLTLLSLMSLATLASCGNNNGDGPISEEAVANFLTGYAELSIESQKPTSDGLISKPSVSTPGIDILGYYTDPSFDVEFDFQNMKITSPTNIYVKSLKGDGSDGNPYLIENGVSLASLTHLGKEIEGKVVLTEDVTTISLYGTSYEATTLQGDFDGNHHSIIFDENTDFVSNTGVFYKIEEGASVKDVKLIGPITGVKASTGALANFNDGVLENITTQGTSYHMTNSGKSNGVDNGVSLMTSYDEEGNLANDFGEPGKLADLQKGGAGGIVGTNHGTIKNSLNNYRVWATIGAGGIAGINHGTIENCFNLAPIGTAGNYAVNSSYITDPTFSFSYLGGIAGANYGTINQCLNTNQVFVARLPWLYGDAPAGYSDYCGRIRVGGIAGANFGTYDETENQYTGGLITECVNYGRIHGDMQVGGIAGYSSGYVSDCFYSGKVGGRYCVAPIVGWQSGDKAGDRISIVQNCIGISRVVAGSLPSTILDQEENDLTSTGVKLTDVSSSNATSNVKEYYKVAKYATDCVYHNYSGNIMPLELDDEDEPSSINTSSTMDASTVYAKVGYRNGSETGKWTHYDDLSKVTSIVGINSSWQVYLNVIPAWQEKTVTVKNGTYSHEFKLTAGINYLGDVLTSNGGKYTSGRDNYQAGAIVGRGLPTARAMGFDVDPGMTLGWTTIEGSLDGLWDGVVRDNMTLYPINAPAA